MDVVPRIVAAGIKLILIFKFYCGKTTPDTDKAVKVSATAVVKSAYNCRNVFKIVSP